MNVAYFDCPAGVAGDMCLGALLDLGVPLDYLQSQLAKLGIADEFELTTETVQRKGQRGLKAQVQLRDRHPHHHRHWPEIEAQIRAAHLPDRARDWSLKVFEALAIAEGAVHGIEPEKVHFHEVGAVDALVDIVGTCLGLDYLDVSHLYCSALPTGGGRVKAAHGQLPVPVPAVLQLCQMYRVPLYSNGIEKELVTPTGAALVCALSEGFGAPPAMTLQRVGLGAGSQDLPLPNLLRLWLGTVPDPMETTTATTIVELQTQLDDMTPQALSYALEQLYAAGAIEVFCQPITMKKSRLGVLLTVLCPLSAEAACVQTLFRETTTLGLRRQVQERYILERQIKTIATTFGEVRVKVAEHQGQRLNVQPEYEDCAALARQHQQPWQVVYQEALAVAQKLWPLG
ncbi:nickel pincer cofactor biosynthesis protein LarC [Thermosynechococcus sp. HN-54]|uniref:nickel pincer cofactor biosynthesis protein LarC n=1 Tax=Thermosynechococcus sp. HN-54 TaxID=2933959 RepID=UPI00202CC7BA|nr:nickel pincer cofactor biosynthesis protein LarC [Thermosynechococcus sp. HN-54]URR34438.1 nickel pincer cofactor biosynthesis protein LarC [Thermosynechococcus sp. HN-54]